MIKLMGKNIFTILRSKVCLSKPAVLICLVAEEFLTQAVSSYISVYSYMLDSNCTCLSVLRDPPNYQLVSTNCSQRMGYICQYSMSGSRTLNQEQTPPVTKTFAPFITAASLTTNTPSSSIALNQQPHFMSRLDLMSTEYLPNSFINSAEFKSLSLSSISTPVEMLNLTCNKCYTSQPITSTNSQQPMAVNTATFKTAKEFEAFHRSQMDFMVVSDQTPEFLYFNRMTENSHSSIHTYSTLQHDSKEIFATTKYSTLHHGSKEIVGKTKALESIDNHSEIEQVVLTNELPVSAPAPARLSTYSSSHQSSSSSATNLFPSFTVQPSELKVQPSELTVQLSELTVQPSKLTIPNSMFGIVSSLGCTEKLQKQPSVTSNVSEFLLNNHLDMNDDQCKIACCSCVYKSCGNLSTIHVYVSDMAQSISDIINSLSIDHKKTGKMLRKRNSAYDSRRSSQAMGIGAVMIIATIFACIVAMDIPRVIVFFKERLFYS